MGKTIEISPFSRVEGDLKLKVDLAGNRVTNAKSSGIMFRGFEKMLKGHFPEDALVFTPRICGICSISHSIAASNALASISEELVPSKSGLHAKNICHATENAMSHVTQFYLYFAPDMLNVKYKENKYYSTIIKRFAPLKGESSVKVLKERKRFLEILGLIIGKWPHSLAIQPGGITKSLNSSDIFRIRGIAAQFISVIEDTLLGMPVKDYLEIKTISEFESIFTDNREVKSDLNLFVQFAKTCGFMDMGKGPGAFISGGVYQQPGGGAYIPKGYWKDGFHEMEDDKITESIAYSYFDSANVSANPFDDCAEPNWEKDNAYSWAKAPRYNQEVVETGALGRQVISDDPLVMDFYRKYGSTVFTRVFARLHEAVKLLDRMNVWIDELSDNENYYSANALKDTASGIGITEAARGFLGHWISVENGVIKNYQVITPTAWNASPRDENEKPGAMETSIMEAVVQDPVNLIEIEHIIRSYDPCLVCTVH